MYAYAKNKDLGPLEEFITGTHLANLQAVGDRWAGNREAWHGGRECLNIEENEVCLSKAKCSTLALNHTQAGALRRACTRRRALSTAASPTTAASPPRSCASTSSRRQWMPRARWVKSVVFSCAAG